MPIPFIAIGIGVGAVALGATIHGALKSGNSALKSGKWQMRIKLKEDEHNAIVPETNKLKDEFIRQSEQLGRLRVDSAETLKDAAKFFRKAEVKDRNFQNLNIPDDVIAHWGQLHYEILESLGIWVAGIGGAAEAAVTAKAGLSKQKAEVEIKKLDKSIAKMRRKIGVMQAVQQRMTELKASIAESRGSLRNLLAKSNVGNIGDAYQVYKLTVALAELLEQPPLSDEQAQDLRG